MSHVPLIPKGSITGKGYILTKNAAGDLIAIAPGANGKVLAADSTAASGLAWVDQTGGGGMTNPMTTLDDVIIGGASGTPARLAKGSNGQVLTISSSGHVVWQNAASGFANPMTTAGDVITGGAAGAAQRLAKGSDGQVLKLVSGAPAWAAESGGGGGATDIGPTPSMHGLLGWSYDPIMVTTNTAVPLDELLGIKINLPGGTTPISNIVVYCETAGSSNTYGRFGIFNSAGTLLARTADAANLSTGLKTMALTAESGQSLPAGGAGVWIKVAMLFKGGTGPGLSANNYFNQAYAMNMNLSGTAGRYTSSYPTAPSTIPATDNSDNTAAGRCYWVGVS